MMIPIYIFLAVALIFFGVGMLMVRARESDQVFASGKKRALIFGPLTSAMAHVLPLGSKTKKRLEIELRQAGYYHQAAITEFLAMRNALVIGWVLLISTLIVLVSKPGEPLEIPLLITGIIGMIVLYAIPRLVLSSRGKARVRRMESALPDALDMISMCMAGGLPFPEALSHVGNELNRPYPDLACELRIVSRQANSASLKKAMTGFAERMNTPEVESLAMVISQTEQHGGAVASAFQDFATDVRKRRRQIAEEKGNRTSIHLLFPLIFCLAPPIYLMLLTPAVIELRDFVMEENGPGGILSPAEATESLQSPLYSTTAAEPQ